MRKPIENLTELALISLTPKMVILLSVDQCDADPDVFSLKTQGASDDSLDFQFTTHRQDVCWLSLVPQD